MPEAPPAKLILHPSKRAASSPRTPVAFADEPYAELQVTSNFTFLTGASHPEEMVMRAAELGHRGIAITDLHSMAGVVRAHTEAKAIGLPLAVGSRLRLHCDSICVDVLAYATDRASYGRLCQLLTIGKRRTTKGNCHLDLHDLLELQQGLLLVVIPPRAICELFIQTAVGLRSVFDDERISLALRYSYSANDLQNLQQHAALVEHLLIPGVATNDVHYHIPQRKDLHDVLTCIRERCTLEQAGLRLGANAERYLKPADEMMRLFETIPDGRLAVARSAHILQRAAAFSLDELRYEYPHETCPTDRTPMQHLTGLTWRGAAERYPSGVPDDVRSRIKHELQLIAELQYPHYFLTVHDIVRFARSQKILCQGRGAAANSAVCYCLGITSVDPDRIDLLFERFVSKERDEPPDIDIDFEHERREEVIQYIYGKYGRHRAALTAEVITYRSRSAVREVGKALGLSLDCVDRLAKNMEWFDPSVPQGPCLRELGVDPADAGIQHLVRLCREILGFPRHLSQHVGGFVLTEGPLSETVPIENAAMPDRTVIEWDKDDIEALGMLKVDVLGLGMLTCVRKCFDLVEQHHGRRIEMHTVPAEDPAVYDMVSNADTIGVFQIESRAQMSMLPRLRPKTFYDLVIEVAIVRPGPIQGKMVHPYLRRRNGEEPIEYPSPQVREVLARTLGVPLFQEQAMSLAIKTAGFTPGEADQLRRAMAAWKRKGNLIYEFGQRIISGMLARGYKQEFAERCFEQIKGFSEYGFPESHAASFALIVYVSAWLKRYYPAAFAAALINSQPMGFYAPAQIVRDAKEHGVEIRPVDVNYSRWDCTLEPNDVPGAAGFPGASDFPGALRLGMRLVKGMKADDAARIEQAVETMGMVHSVEALHHRSGAPVRALRCLASADAFGSMGLTRQQATWMIRELRDEPLPLFEGVQMDSDDEDMTILPPIAPPIQVVQDYAATGLSLKAHPVSFLRAELDAQHVTSNAELQDESLCPNGRLVTVAGLTLVRQRPGTASGIVFMTIEDETGLANLIVRPHIFDRYRRIARHAQFLLARGPVERQGQVVHIMVQSMHDGAMMRDKLRVRSRDFH